MRTEQEMMKQILDFAKEDSRILAVFQNGSRVNSNISPDSLQDYDIVYLVKETNSFFEDLSWLNYFGEQVIMQIPNQSSLFPSSYWDAFLMLFKDGNRIDLTILPEEELDKYLKTSTLTKVLLDKDQLIPPIPPSSEVGYFTKSPSKENFLDSCTEFWWVSTYVMKGLLRNQYLYAVDHISIIRDESLRMMSWTIASQFDFQINLGKSYHKLEQLLPKEDFRKLQQTYSLTSYQEIETSLFLIIELFQKYSNNISTQLNYPYPIEQEKNVLDYIKRRYEFYPDLRKRSSK